MNLKEDNNNNKFYWQLEIWLTTFLSHPQIAYKLIEAGGAEDILQVQGFEDILQVQDERFMCLTALFAYSQINGGAKI